VWFVLRDNKAADALSSQGDVTSSSLAMLPRPVAFLVTCRANAFGALFPVKVVVS